MLGRLLSNSHHPSLLTRVKAPGWESTAGRLHVVCPTSRTTCHAVFKANVARSLHFGQLTSKPSATLLCTMERFSLQTSQSQLYETGTKETVPPV